MKNLITRAFVLLLLLSTAPVLASEGGDSHYTPGMIASFIDYPSGVPYNVLSAFLGYGGSASASRQFPIAGLLTADLHARSAAWTPIFQYDLPDKVLGGKYAFTVAIPVMTLDVDASIIGPNGGRVTKSESKAGLGDIYFSPITLYWKKGNFSYEGAVAMYAPSGSFNVGSLANLGKNYWTFNPYAGFSYDNQKSGLQANAYLGLNFNTKNNATDYQSGQELYFDFTVDKRFKSGFGAGGTGYVFQQITGDSGSGAKLGSFKGRTVGFGPEISYFTPLDKNVLFAMELKWLPELEVQNRTKGNFVWFKFAFIFN